MVSGYVDDITKADKLEFISLVNVSQSTFVYVEDISSLLWISLWDVWALLVGCVLDRECF